MDIVRLLEANSVPFKQHGEHHHASRGWVSTDCPYCSPGSGRYRLGWELATGRVNCWNCGIRRGAEALCLLIRCSEAKARRLWNSISFDRRVNYSDADDTDFKVLKTPAGVGPLLDQHRSYLLSRKLESSRIEQLWGVKGIGLAPDLAWRLYIPIYDREGREVSWTTRSIAKDAELRYRSARPDQEAISLKKVLYGAHLARHVVVVVEGPVDAWAIGPGAVATCGVVYTPTQVGLISEYPVRYVCFDRQQDAQRRAQRLCTQLADFPGVTENIELETGEDPGNADVSELLEIRRLIEES